jgi:hypothetical protein
MPASPNCKFTTDISKEESNMYVRRNNKLRLLDMWRDEHKAEYQGMLMYVCSAESERTL